MVLAFHRLIHILNMLGEVFGARAQAGRSQTLRDTERDLLIDAICELMVAASISESDLTEEFKRRAA
jgi:hypothetical protein